MKRKYLKPKARFREFVRAHPGAVDLSTAVAIEDAIDTGRKVHFKLLEEVFSRLQKRITNMPELVRLIALHDENGWYGWRELENFLEQVSELIGGAGVEATTDDSNDVTFTYVNTGDSYTTTIAHDGRKLLVTSWGDWIDWAEHVRRPRLSFR